MKELTQANWHELPEPDVVRLPESDRASGLTQAGVELENGSAAKAPMSLDAAYHRFP